MRFRLQNLLQIMVHVQCTLQKITSKAINNAQLSLTKNLRFPQLLIS